MPAKLSTTINKIQLIPNLANREAISAFHAYLMSNDLSVHHVNNNLKASLAFANYLGPEISFNDITSKQQVLSFLDSKRKSVDDDPDMKWITTWNHYLNRLRLFFRWFHNRYARSNEEPVGEPDWETPDMVRIKSRKSKRVSPYSESDIWDLEELKTLIKYEPYLRNKAAIALMWDLNGRNHEITMLRIKHIRLKERYGEGEIPHQAKTGSGPILLTFSFPYVRDWLNEHPFRNTLDARLICNLNNGAPINPEALWTMMKQLRSRVIRLVETDSITDNAERNKLQGLIATKRFNPYCLRHSSISNDSDFLPDYALKKKVRWSMNSKQPSRYIKARMGNDLKQKILVQNGIISETDGRPKPSISDCPRCSLVNCVDNKFCSRCGYPLIPSAFEEIKAAEDMKVKILEQKYEQDIKSVREQIGSIFKVLEKLRDQKDINVVASTLYRSGQLKVHR